MQFLTIFVALASALVVSAQQNFTIMVGMNKTNTFTPSYINATTGDTITFQFVAGNHTVTQSSFASPCENVSTPMTGIDSGFMPVSTNASMMPMEYTFTMTSDNTTWFYCRQTGHCQKGMVFAINPTEQKTFAMFQKLAHLSDTQAAAEASGNTTTGSATMSSPANPYPTSGAVALSSSAFGIMSIVAVLSAVLV
ncbi:Cupredoxin [Hygrophoropsis aurantiaca]|uniref:Cupredoxin n=1 Tax=Hygrophoropsis aurantiaca TaxID=72124 RepID=A0ACB8ALF1_9AGAM|nr:Cupredoxin [Hygrophoropsis aurantiaca]